MSQLECSLFKPPHDYLQACTENLLNIEGIVCKTTSSRVELGDDSIKNNTEPIINFLRED